MERAEAQRVKLGLHAGAGGAGWGYVMERELGTSWSCVFGQFFTFVKGGAGSVESGRWMVLYLFPEDGKTRSVSEGKGLQTAAIYSGNVKSWRNVSKRGHLNSEKRLRFPLFKDVLTGNLQGPSVLHERPANTW
ncbi:hypothetical protein Q8A73_018113 [Channa argus]|nr:hypothetical protein Q8A73_018113 [Channa argus]